MNLSELIEYAREHGSKPERTETITAAGVTLIEWRFKAGSVQISEIHTHDHLSILISGEGILAEGGTERRLVGPCTLEIKAGTEHAFHAITDCVWDCIHAGGEPSVERNL